MKKKEFLTLSEYLKQTGVTQRFLANKIGVHAESIHRILRKGQMPTLQLALDIEKATGGHVSVYSWDISNVNQSEKTETADDKKNKHGDT